MVEANLENSGMLLKVSYSGKVTVEETKSCAAQVKALLPELKPGFQLLTDLSQLIAMNLDCVPDIELMMDWLNQHGVKMVVRVIPDPQKDVGFNIMSLFHYRRGVRILTCETLEQARQALTGSS